MRLAALALLFAACGDPDGGQHLGGAWQQLDTPDRLFFYVEGNYRREMPGRTVNGRWQIDSYDLTLTHDGVTWHGLADNPPCPTTDFLYCLRLEGEGVHELYRGLLISSTGVWY